MNQTDTPHRFAVISASWHADLVDPACEAFTSDLEAAGIAPDAIDRFAVPGAFEIPLLAQRLARSGDYAAITAFALVVDGGIYRHEFVATAVIDGLMRVGLDTGVPVLSAVLTPHQFHEHETHRTWFAEHLVGKGHEAARAALQTVAVHGAIGTEHRALQTA